VFIFSGFLLPGCNYLILVPFRQPSLQAASASPDPQQVVQLAWELAKQSGSYSFIAQVDQLNVPLPTPLNVGKQSHQQSVRLKVGRT
jgi:hypothetical protein